MSFRMMGRNDGGDAYFAAAPAHVASFINQEPTLNVGIADPGQNVAANISVGAQREAGSIER